jgi:hypothetical protein
MTDVPQFAAQVKLFDDLHAHDFPFRDLFVVDLFTPNLLGYVLVWPLAQLVGLVASVKIVLAVALASLPLVASRVFERTGGDPAWVWLVVPVGYGFCLNWGFINFLLALPLGLLLLDGCTRFAHDPSLGRGLLLALLVHLLFFAHLLVLSFFGSVAATIVTFDAAAKRRPIALLPFASLVPIALTWSLSVLLYEPQVRKAVRWNLGWDRPMLLFSYMLGEDPSLDTVLVGVALFALPLLAGARVSREPRRWLPVVACLIVSLFAPGAAGGAFFLHHRFPMLLVPLFLFALDARVGPSMLRGRTAELAAVTLAVAWIAVAVMRFSTFASEARDFEPVLARMEPGRRALALIFDPLDRCYQLPVFLHYPVWYGTLKAGVVDPSFAQLYNEPVRYRAGRPHYVGNGFVPRHATVDWDHLPPYDYLVVRDDADEPTWVPNRLAPRWKLVVRSGEWSLFELDLAKQNGSREYEVDSGSQQATPPTRP